VSRTAAARPRALHRFDQRTVFPTRKRPRNALPTHWGRQKSAELRANQEAEMDATHGDKKNAENSAFWTV